MEDLQDENNTLKEENKNLNNRIKELEEVIEDCIYNLKHA